MITKHKKKPVIIEAIQLKGDSKTIKECLEFMGQSVNEDLAIERNKFEDYCLMVNEKGMKIPTLEGEMTASINDYIIKGVKGEFYPCKPDIFVQTYEQADKKSGIDLIRKERNRQINDEGWDINSDIKKHGGDELSIVAACYALPEHKRLNIQYPETWDTKWWKPTPEDRVKELTKAGALIAAEIDRLLAIENSKPIQTNLEECFNHINERFQIFLVRKAKNYQLFSNNLKYFTDCYLDEYLEFTQPEDYVSNAFDFTLAMRPYPNYWEDVESEWFEVLNRIINNK